MFRVLLHDVALQSDQRVLILRGYPSLLFAKYNTGQPSKLNTFTNIRATVLFIGYFSTLQRRSFPVALLSGWK